MKLLLDCEKDLHINDHLALVFFFILKSFQMKLRVMKSKKIIDAWEETAPNDIYMFWHILTNPPSECNLVLGIEICYVRGGHKYV